MPDIPWTLNSFTQWAYLTMPIDTQIKRDTCSKLAAERFGPPPPLRRIPLMRDAASHLFFNTADAGGYHQQLKELRREDFVHYALS
jgi:hypothetical protein